MTVKKWSETRWESRLVNVKAIRYQMPEILNALEEVSNTSPDSLLRSGCKSLEDEIIKVNTISKNKSTNMDLDISASMLNGLLSFFNDYRNTGFESARTTAKDLAEKTELEKCCHDLQNVLTEGELKDTNCHELYEELLIFCTMISEETTAFQALSVLKKCCGSYPNISIALRIIRSIPVTSASAERSFSKLKIIKNYLRSTLSQCKLTSLATQSIKQEISDSLDFNELIDIFAATKTKKKFF
ncbi:uncharacterized protein LOC126895174 [Daktulosphaira vitifoliae]|uniref:uncharacterized protein LOC126895174 n=1 Tax=Daktulosphaira vitifoliae TaxID=58002 RepID=UPI0021AADE2D|nr:uncharacterized protein LOC126895174 [Daktulosphaira vitifoliae]